MKPGSEIEVEVTAEDAAAGRRAHACECPVALAVRRKVPGATSVAVDPYFTVERSWYWAAVVVVPGRRFYLSLPPEEVERIKAYDAGGEMEPHTVTLRVAA